MNVIFCDLDGTLNNENSFWKFYYSEDGDKLNIDSKNVEALAYICRETNSEVVITSSCKLNLENNHWGFYLNLMMMLNFYGIHVKDVTPNIPNFEKDNGGRMWKEWDITCYLYEHPEVTNFCIFDDETYDLQTMLDYLVQTKYNIDNTGNGGIQKEMLEDAKKALCRSKNFKGWI